MPVGMSLSCLIRFRPGISERGTFSSCGSAIACLPRGGERDLEGHLWAYVPGALVTPHNKPILRNRWVSRRWAQLSWPPIGRAMREAGFAEADLLYCDSAVPFSWLRDVPHRKAIYRIADHYSAFDKFSPALAESELDLAPWSTLSSMPLKRWKNM